LALAVVLAGVVMGAGAWFLLRTGMDPAADRASRSTAASGAQPARQDTPPAREAAATAPRGPEPAPPAVAKRRAAPAPAPSAPAPAAEPAAPTTATLRIVSDVPGAQVFLNREFVGATPATASALAPGSYQLNVSAPGYDNHVETLELAAGEREVLVRFREVRLNASLEVVHKHRFGSCRGTLLATPQGIRYQTTNKDDAFEAALTTLETFQIDYLNKNLRIQPRQGKRYDFTDPEGNADRLFVFHRDVERARDQLKKGETP
jgi:hypothetical protein